MSRPSRPAHPTQDARVLLFDCEAYDVPRIRPLVAEAATQLGLRPHGRTLVKPNRVAAGDPMTDLAVGERCAIGTPCPIRGAPTRGEARPEIEPAE